MIVDTSVLIEFMRGNKNVVVGMSELSVNNVLKISTMTIVELYQYCGSLKNVEQVIHEFEIIEIDRQIAKLSGLIYRNLVLSGQMINTEDCVIGATGILEGEPVWTLNKKHFSRIEGLELY